MAPISSSTTQLCPHSHQGRLRSDRIQISSEGVERRNALNRVVSKSKDGSHPVHPPTSLLDDEVQAVASHSIITVPEAGIYSNDRLDYDYTVSITNSSKRTPTRERNQDCSWKS